MIAPTHAWVSAVVASVLLQATPPRADTAVQESTPPAVRVQVLSPGEDAYVSGPTLLRARVEPDGAAATVIFFVDGRQVCSVGKPPFECDWDAGDVILEHQVRVVANLFAGGRVVQTVRTKALGYVEAVDVDAVQVTVTVMDGNGHFIRGLPKGSFHVSEDGARQTISSFAAEDVPLDLVVAIDISGSMTPAMTKLKAAAKEFLGAIPAKDQVTLLGFNDNIFTLTRRATDASERIRAVDRLAPWGATSLYDVIIRGVDLLGRKTGRKALIVFTDGEDQGSHASFAAVERRLQASDATLYMIGQGQGVERENLRTIMQRLVRPTGGRALFTNKIDELHDAFTELLDELSNQYLLGYAPASTRRDNKWRSIAVSVDGYREVRARQGYRPGAGK